MLAPTAEGTGQRSQPRKQTPAWGRQSYPRSKYGMLLAATTPYPHTGAASKQSPADKPQQAALLPLLPGSQPLCLHGLEGDVLQR